MKYILAMFFYFIMASGFARENGVYSISNCKYELSSSSETIVYKNCMKKEIELASSLVIPAKNLVSIHLENQKLYIKLINGVTQRSVALFPTGALGNYGRSCVDSDTDIFDTKAPAVPYICGVQLFDSGDHFTILTGEIAFLFEEKGITKLIYEENGSWTESRKVKVFFELEKI